VKVKSVYSLLLLLLIALSCDKSETPTYPYEAKVLGINSDCGLYQIKITVGLDNVISVAGTTVGDSIYIADNLPAGLMIAGISIKLDLRKPNDNELGSCTDLGPSYTWIFVTDAIEK
jgi:hypothetical protein